jgi:hypothetical protein
MFPRYAGHKFKTKDKQDDGDPWWHLMNDEDVLGKIEEDIAE